MSTTEAWRLMLGRLRAAWFRARGARVGPKVSIGPRFDAARPRAIAIGTRATLESDVYLKLVGADAALTIGEYTFVGRGCEFDVKSRLAIGAHTLIAPGCFVTDHEHGTAPHLPMDRQPLPPSPVTIGADVWLGYGVVVLPGVTIGDGAVVGAGSVVTRDVPRGAIFIGAPARLLRMRNVDA